MTTGRDDSRTLARAMSGQQDQMYVLRLYVSGASSKSFAAITNIKNICDRNLVGRYELEVVDIYQQPERAISDQVIAAPMLVKELPRPLRRLIGTLSNTADVLRALGLPPSAVARGARTRRRSQERG